VRNTKWLEMRLFALILFSNLALRIFVNWPISSAISTPDSISYRPSLPGPQTFPYEGLVPLSQLSAIDLFGNSLRPWLINAIMQSLRSDYVIVYFNIFLGSLAWTLLIFSIARLFKTKLFKLLASSIVFVFSLTVYVYSWDKFILSEPIVNSFFIIFVALVIYRSQMNVSFSADALIFTFWAAISISRPVIGLLLTPLLFINERRVNRKLLYKLLLVLTTCLYVFVINKNSSDKWLEFMGTPREGLSFAHLSSSEFAYRDDFISFAERNEAPLCLSSNKNVDLSPWFLARTYKTNCPTGVTWLKEQFGTKFLGFVIEPSNLQTFVFGKSSLAMSGVDFRGFYPYETYRSLPINNSLTSLLWNNDEVMYLIKLIFYVLFILYYIFIDKTRSSAAMIGILTLSFLGSIMQITLMPLDYQRLGLPGSFIFNLFLPIFVLLFLETRVKTILLRKK
jgi:hypothetical protein